MKKYLTVFAVSWQNEFTYRLNFILWRVRNIVRFLMTYFLWSGIFVSSAVIFGYSKDQILTYIFMILAVWTFVLSAPSSDNVGGEIANGDLSNYLVKPIGYLKYWFTRDLASKLLNLTFAAGEITILWFIFRPPLQLPPDWISGIIFLFFCGLAMILYFFINIVTKFVAFWVPENTWGITFVALVFIEILAGGMFPLDVLPKWAGTLLQFTPFPYLLYYPVAIFIGKITGMELLRITGQAVVWAVVMFLLTRFVWKKGLVAYASEGR